MKTFNYLPTDTIIRGFVVRAENGNHRVWAANAEALSLAKAVGLDLAGQDSYCGDFDMTLEALIAEINSF